MIWPASGKPLALRNWVAFMPSRAAVSVMRWAKAASEPEIRSPNAVATSLAERATRACSACSTVIDPPGATPSFEAGLALARLRKGHRRGQGQAAGLQLLEDDVDRHHLGERGRIPEGAGIALQQGLAGGGIDHHVGAGHDRPGRRGHRGDLGPGGGRAKAEEAQDAEQKTQVHCRRRMRDPQHTPFRCRAGGIRSRACSRS